MINITNAEEAINELVSLSKILTSLGVRYENQKPVLDLAEKIYVKEVLPVITKTDKQ